MFMSGWDENPIAGFENLGTTGEVDFQPPFQNTTAMPYFAPMRREGGGVLYQPELLLAGHKHFLPHSLHGLFPVDVLKPDSVRVHGDSPSPVAALL